VRRLLEVTGLACVFDTFDCREDALQRLGRPRSATLRGPGRSGSPEMSDTHPPLRSCIAPPLSAAGGEASCA
jgi:hypothetical protein